MRARTVLWVATFVLICGAMTTLLKTVDRTIFRSRGRGPANVSAPLQSSPVVSRSNSLGLAIPKPPAASASDQHWEAMKLLTEATVAQRDALGSIEQWETEISPLLDDEQGEAIAVNKDLVEKLAYVLGKDRVSDSEINVIGEQIGLLQDRLKTLAGKSPPEAFSAREMYEIRQLHSKISTAKRGWEQAFKQSTAIILKANRDANPITEPTLRQSLDQIDTDATLKALDDKIADDGEPDAGPESVDYDVPSEIDPQLHKEALSVEVRSALAPFLEPRTVQPSLAGRFSINGSRTSAKQPMSLGKLMSIGALSDSLLGLKKLARIGGNRKLPEPKWSIASQPNSWSEDDVEFLRKAQQMLRDYGAILVEEGLLSR